jgi:prolyl oligopeptidase
MLARLFRPLVRVVGLSLLTLALVACASAQKLTYPQTRVEPVVEEIHGVKVTDSYRWLENGGDPQVQTWTAAQNAVTRQYFDRYPKAREELAGRLRELYAAGRTSTPVLYGKNYFYTQRSGQQNHAVLYVREGGYSKDPRVVIDPNTFSADGTVAMDWWYPSPDGAFIGYGVSANGDEKSTLHLRDVKTAGDTVLTIPNTRYCSVAWDKEGGGFLYTAYPAPGSVPPGDENYYRHVYYHKFGTLVKNDPKVFGADLPKEALVGVTNSGDYRYVFLSTAVDWAKNDLYFRRASDKQFKPLVVGLDGQFDADALDNQLIVRTNYKAPRYRIVALDPDQPAEADWREIIPEGKGSIQSMELAGGKIVVNVLEDVYAHLRVYDAAGKLLKELELPTLGTVTGLSGRPDRADLFFTFESLVYPPVIFKYNTETDELREYEKSTLNVDATAYETKQVWFNSKDGTRVPMFVVYKKDLKLDGNNPALLTGYGGFDISSTPTFSEGRLPWLEHGGVFAVANLRGGGEFGREWHLAGRLDKKQNCFDDMIAAAEKLVADHYTRPEKLAIRGGSNGGLLMGAVLTQRPDLFRAVVCEVPLLDMLRYHRTQIARLWIPEYGTAENADQFKYLYAYSPYQHVQPGTKYPAILLATADSDSRVDPMHARKMAALLQASTASDHPVLLRVETKAGHGAGMPLTKRIDEQVDALVFTMAELGMLARQ